MFKPITAKELASLPAAEPTIPLLASPSGDDHLLLRGRRSVLGAASGQGKSTIVAAIAVAVAKGTDFLNYKGDGSSVLILDFEQTHEDLKQKLDLFGGLECDNIDIVIRQEGIDIAKDDVRDGLEALFANGKEYGLVVADPFYKMHTYSTNDEEAMRHVTMWWDGARAKHGFHLMVPMHMRKEQGGWRKDNTRTMDDILGSSILNYGAEVVLGWQRVNSPPIRHPDMPGVSNLYFWKDRRGKLPVGERWRIHYYRDGRFERDVSDVRLTNADDVKDWLIRVSPRGLTADELRDFVGVRDPGNMNRIVKTLADDPYSGVDRRKNEFGRWEYFASSIPADHVNSWKQELWEDEEL